MIPIHSPRKRSTKKCTVFLPGLLLLMMFALPVSHALPRYSLMIGASCGSCHVNPTGGQMRTEYGTLYGIERVPIEATREDDFTFSGKLSENISIGGDHRSQFVYDAYSGTHGFQMMTTALYACVTLSPKFQIAMKYDITNTMTFNGTEVFALAKILPGGWYVKMGSFLPEYGWRGDDHTSFVRGGNLGRLSGLQPNSGLIFLPNYKDLGLEAGGVAGNVTITAGLFNGTGNSTPVDFRKQKAVVARIEYITSVAGINLRLGASGYGFREYRMGGFTLGAAYGDVVLMTEVDWTHDRLSGGTVVDGENAMALSTELDVKAVQGLWCIAKHEFFDPLQGVENVETAPSGNSIQRIILGVEFFPYGNVEIRPQFRYNIEQPELSGNNQYIVQLHCWF